MHYPLPLLGAPSPIACPGFLQHAKNLSIRKASGFADGSLPVLTLGIRICAGV